MINRPEVLALFGRQAVQLHTGAEGFLSGFTAAHLYGLRSMPTSRIVATVFRHRQTSLPRWVDRSYTNWHDARDVVDHRGFRLERPLSMMFTLAACCNDHRFERAAEDAWNLGLISPAAAREHVERYRRSGRSGVARFNRWLDKSGVRQRAMQSNFEVDVLDAIRRATRPVVCSAGTSPGTARTRAATSPQWAADRRALPRPRR